MKSTLDSRTSEKAAREQASAAGGYGAKEPVESAPPCPGAPRSWRQYIDQTIPIQDAGMKAEQRQESPSAAATGPNGKERARAAWDGFTRWAEENGRKALSGAAAAWEKLAGATAAGREKLGQGTEKVRGLVARHPVSPLLYVTLLAVGIGAAALQGSYARAASDGLDREADAVLYAAPVSLGGIGGAEDERFAYTQAWAISVDGVELGYAADRSEFYRMLDEIAQPYLPDGSVRYEFEEDVQVYPVELPSDTRFSDLEPIREELSALRVEEAVYVVKKGDTFNAIAYSLGMMPNELSVLNPDVIVNTLWVDQELIIQQAVPRLSVVAVANETYEEVIPSPVEYIETADLYVGDTKVKEKGEDGLALVNADVTYINNVEQGREILESATLKETTVTYMYTGTTPRPKTASNGYFIWPVKGPITSNFGSRDLWGSYNYHLGIDIGCSTGTTIKAADGGTVITAGWNNGGYGYLVVIRHDNGMLTYYAHNSSILVKVGEKVYQGQAIAKAGMTGKADGPHCHFEIRVNGTCVNPRNYL